MARCYEALTVISAELEEFRRVDAIPDIGVGLDVEREDALLTARVRQVQSILDNVVSASSKRLTIESMVSVSVKIGEHIAKAVFDAAPKGAVEMTLRPAFIKSKIIKPTPYKSYQEAVR